MKLAQTLTVLLVAASSQLALAAPVKNTESTGLETRGLEARKASGVGNSKGNPQKVQISVNDKGALPFDADCWAMLCKGQTRVMQRVVTSVKSKNRQEKGSGAKKNPFMPLKKGVKQPPAANQWSNNQQYTSPEEFPFASSLQGGRGAYLFPATGTSQNSQGASMTNLYRDYSIDIYDPSCGNEDDTWYEITGFTGDLGPHCKAFNSNDKSLCSKSSPGDWGFDVADYAYEYDGTNFNYVGK